ncbi:MAG: crotonase/enoyl-CoA hydratase family protein [Myxococcota bacterium]
MKPPSATDPPPEGRIVTETRGHVRLIGIDRPKKYNGFTPEMVTALADAYQAFEDDPEVWCALLWAEGEHFTAGLQLDRFDIASDLGVEGKVDPLDLRAPRRTKPVVAAVHGICFTIGIELMLAADIVVAGEQTRFAQLEVQRGLMAYGGATIRMVERAGWGNAMRYLLTGDEFGTDVALRLGFVQEAVPNDEVFARGLALAQRVAGQAPLAVQASRRSAQLAREEGHDHAVAAFRSQLAKLAGTADFAEGVQSFLERRPGKFRGR